MVANYDATSPIEVSYKRNFEGEPTGAKNPELLYNLKYSHDKRYGTFYSVPGRSSSCDKNDVPAEDADAGGR